VNFLLKIEDCEMKRGKILAGTSSHQPSATVTTTLTTCPPLGIASSDRDPRADRRDEDADDGRRK
jgi:hypothetical protein